MAEGALSSVMDAAIACLPLQPNEAPRFESVGEQGVVRIHTHAVALEARRNGSMGERKQQIAPAV